MDKIFKNDRSGEFRLLHGTILACSPHSSVLAISLITHLQSDYLSKEITEKEFNDQFSTTIDEVKTFVNNCDCIRKRRR